MDAACPLPTRISLKLPEVQEQMMARIERRRRKK